MLKRILFTTALLFWLLNVCNAQKNNLNKFAGVWTGTVDSGSQTATIILKLQVKEDKLTGTLESPEQSENVFTIENIKITQNKFQFEITDVKIAFDGAFKEDLKKIEGTLIASEQGYPLVLIKENDAIKFVGIWKGTFDLGGIYNPIFKIQEKNGKLSGTVESPETGNSVFPLENITVSGNKLQFEIPSVQASYEGLYKDDTKKINGNFASGGQSTSLVLTKDQRDATLIKK